MFLGPDLKCFWWYVLENNLKSTCSCISNTAFLNMYSVEHQVQEMLQVNIALDLNKIEKSLVLCPPIGEPCAYQHSKTLRSSAVNAPEEYQDAQTFDNKTMFFQRLSIGT